MKKEIGKVLAAGGIFCVLTGCVAMTEKEKMLSYMEEKYEKDFIYLEDYAGQLGKPYKMIVVAQADCPERTALVRVVKEEQSVCYQDNYLAHIVKEELEDIISSFAAECFGKSTVEYCLPQFVLPADYGPELSAVEFLKDRTSRKQFWIYPENQMEEEALKVGTKQFCARLKKAGYSIGGTVYQKDMRLIFSMDEKGELCYLRLLSPEGSSG